MEDAKSMYHGGELVSALDCDFESYRELGLLCPFCNEPVYLCGETVRQSSRTHKLSYIRPHFKHFPGGDPMDFDCEKRAISAEGKRYLDAIRAERRGQRLELFNRYFLEMIYKPSSGFPLSSGSVKRIVGRGEGDLSFRSWIDGYVKVLPRVCAEDVRLILTKRMNVTKKSGEILRAPQYGFQLVEEKLNFLLSTVDIKIHIAIVLEAVSFLTSNRGRGALTHLALQAQASDYAYTGKRSGTWESSLTLLFALTMTDWQQQLEEKSKLLRTDTAGRGFAKAR